MRRTTKQATPLAGPTVRGDPGTILPGGSVDAPNNRKPDRSPTAVPVDTPPSSLPARDGLPIADGGSMPLTAVAALCRRIAASVNRVMVGKEAVVARLLVALLC